MQSCSCTLLVEVRGLDYSGAFGCCPARRRARRTTGVTTGRRGLRPAQLPSLRLLREPASSPGVGREGERRLGQQLTALLAQLGQLLRLERLRVRAGWSDTERVGIPPLLERLVLGRRRQLRLLDVAQAGCRKQLDEVSLPPARAIRLARQVRVQ